MLGAEQARPIQLSRRELLAAGVGTALGVVMIAGCESKPADPASYNGPIEAMKGLPLLTEARFKLITGALADSGLPMFERVAADITTLHTSSKNPEELPTTIIDEETTPLAITRDNGLTAFAEFQTSSETGSGFLLQTADGIQELPYFSPAVLGIRLGFANELDKHDPIHEGLYLAKEHLSLMLFTGMSEDYHMHLPDGQRLLEKDGNEMTDPKNLERAGFSTLVTRTGMEGSDAWKAIDIMPVLLLTPSIIELGRKGILPESTSTLGNFYRVAEEVLNDPKLYQALVDLSDAWLDSPTMTGPKDIADLVKNPVISSAIERIFKKVYANGIPQ